MITSHAPMLDLAESILYLAALVADQPRPIDRYIDYFGGVTERPHAQAASARRLAS